VGANTVQTDLSDKDVRNCFGLVGEQVKSIVKPLDGMCVKPNLRLTGNYFGTHEMFFLADIIA
jgi:hypothetical protein